MRLREVGKLVSVPLEYAMALEIGKKYMQKCENVVAEKMAKDETYTNPLIKNSHQKSIVLEPLLRWEI